MPGRSAVNSRCLATLAAVLMTGCMAAQPEPPVQLRVLEQGAHCGSEVSGSRWEPADTGWRLRLSMGQQPTGGYVVELADRDVRRVDGAWELHVVWREPGPDELVTQALTAPCLLLDVPWDEPVPLRILDQHGQDRLVVDTDGAADR